MINVDIFNFINHSLQNSFFDFIMPIITSLGGFEILIVACILVFIFSVIFEDDNVRKIALLCTLSLSLIGFCLAIKTLIYMLELVTGPPGMKTQPMPLTEIFTMLMLVYAQFCFFYWQ